LLQHTRIDHGSEKEVDRKRGAPRLFDAFTLNHEFDLFRAHVFENADRVHAFIVVESEFRHSGGLKTEQEMVVKPFLDKFRKENPSLPEIHYVLAEATQSITNGEKSPEYLLMNVGMDYMLRGFNELGGEDRDFIMVSEVDEILNGRNETCWGNLASNNLSETIVHFTQQAANFYKHSFKCHTNGMWWKGPVITSGKVLREIGASNVRESDSHGGGCADRNATGFEFKFPCTLGGNKRMFIKEEAGCSWQLSNFGGVEVAMRKFAMNADGPGKISYDPEVLRDRMNSCDSLIEGTEAYVRVNDSSTLDYPEIPWYVSQHRSAFAEFFEV
jgi:hypothetical protein